jgi:hypothetical protein
MRGEAAPLGVTRANPSSAGKAGRASARPRYGQRSRRACASALSTVPTDYGIDPGELAEALEARRLREPVRLASTRISRSAAAAPSPAAASLPKRYAHTHDPFVALAFAAARTRRLLLGTGVALLPQRDPIIAAKSVASLDQLSGGRFLLPPPPPSFSKLWLTFFFDST